MGKDSSRVLVERVGAVDIGRLGQRVGLLAHEELWAVDDGPPTVLGIL